MAGIKTKKVQGIGRLQIDYAIDQFLRHYQLKNLSLRTIEYYTEDLRYFQRTTNPFSISTCHVEMVVLMSRTND